MDRKFLEGFGLEKDIIDKVLNQNGAEITALKTQLTTKDTEIKTLRDGLTAANSKIAEYEQVDLDGLKRELKVEREARAKDQQNWSLTSTLKESGCKDIDYILYRLEKDGKMPTFENGSIQDKDGFVSDIKEAYSAQFEAETPGGTGSVGNFQRDRTAKTVTKEQFKQMGYLERIRLKSDDPDTYNQLTKE